MFEENQSVNTMDVAEPLQDNEPIVQDNSNVEPVEPTPNVSEEIVAPQVDAKPVQDAQTNAMYANIRRETASKERDKVIAEIFGERGITSYAQYQQAVQEQQRQQQAQQMGVDPQFYNQFMQMQDKLNLIEKEKSFIEDEQRLLKDPVTANLYNGWKSDIHDIATQFGINLDTAFSVVLRNNIGDILGQTQKSVQQETIKKINNNAVTSPGGLGSESASTKQSVSQMSAKDFKELVDKASRGEIKEF